MKGSCAWESAAGWSVSYFLQTYMYQSSCIGRSTYEEEEEEDEITNFHIYISDGPF